MVSKFFFSTDSVKPQKTTPGGSLTLVTAKEVPGFVNIAFSNLRLKPRGSIEPIWHPNANKIGYCTAGNLLVSIRTTGHAETFTVKKGEIFFIPQGYIHHIENIYAGDSIVSFALDNVSPETMYFSKAIYSISDSVFNSTFNTTTPFFEGIKKTKNETSIKTLPSLAEIPTPMGNRYKFDLEGSKKTVMTKGGYLQLGTKVNLPVLQGLAILGFGLSPKGCVEPHWHTNAGELVYIVKGRTKITVLSPDGQVEVMEVSGGQGAFAPASHFHNIENIGSDEVEVIAYFTHHDPDYIGIGEVFGSYSNEVLASVFNTPEDYFDTFKKTEDPLVIVPV